MTPLRSALLAASFDRLGTIDANSETSLQAAVPMFYRVVGTTNAPPAGMIWVDAGDTVQGQPEVSHARPVHTNYVSGFWMDEMEVSKELWTAVHAWALTNGYSFDNAGVAKTNAHPIHTVNWHDAVKWCNARSQREGLTPCYYTTSARTTIYQTGNTNIVSTSVQWDANGYRLPTEAEWEKGARSGFTRCHFPWGSDTILHAQANYYSSDTYAAYDLSPTRGSHPAYTNGGVPYTSPVGSFPASPLGLHDMAGNLWEWCWDWYDDYEGVYQVDPRGPDFPVYGSRSVRGGCWFYMASYARCGYRYMEPPYIEDIYTGFRTVRGP